MANFGYAQYLRRAESMDTLGRLSALDTNTVSGVNESIAVGKVRVNPCDIVVADANGIVIVPRQRAPEVAEVAHSIEKSEATIRDLIANGSIIAEAREELDYHSLQRRE